MRVRKWLRHEDLAIRVSGATRLLPVDIAAGTTRQFWITVRVPDDAAPATYEGTVTVYPGNALRQELTLRVQVHPFELAPPCLFSIYFYDADEATGARLLEQRATWEAVHEAGGKCGSRFLPRGLARWRDVLDMPNVHVAKAAYVDEVHKHGGRMLNYMNPQCGVEQLTCRIEWKRPDNSWPTFRSSVSSVPRFPARSPRRETWTRCESRWCCESAGCGKRFRQPTRWEMLTLIEQWS